jgi:rod shape-determining protein MreC
MFAAAKATPDALVDRSSEVLVLHELAESMGPPAAIPAMGPPASLAGDGTPPPAPAAKAKQP